MTAQEEGLVLKQYGDLVDRILVLTDALRDVTNTAHFYDMPDDVREMVNRALGNGNVDAPARD